MNTNFDWLTFFWGGALGSFIGACLILGLERILNFFQERSRKIHEMDLISKSLTAEIIINSEQCKKTLNS